MEKFSAFVVNSRKAFYVIFIIISIFCVFWMSKVKVNNDIASYLPETTETKKGINLMDTEFKTYPAVSVMVSNITFDEAEALIDKIKNIEGVRDVKLENDDEHYKGSEALFDVTLTYTSTDELDKQLDCCEEIKNELSMYDVYVYSDSIDDTPRKLAKQMNIILVLAFITIILVLLFTSSSFTEVPIYITVFGVAAIMNKGTNFFMGEISYISNSIAVVLQLALAIDYSIIMSHRFDEEKKTKTPYEAIVAALSKAILEISSSCLTTVSGLAALIMMQLRVGADMGLVLCKAILCSLLCVFFLMPGLLLTFSKSIDKTKHKSFVPKISLLSRFVYKMRYIFPIVFAVAAIGGAVLSNLMQYSFDQKDFPVNHETESSIAHKKINETFGIKHQLAVIVPGRDYEKQTALINKISSLEHITGAIGIANQEAKNGYMISDKLNAREFADMMDMSFSTSKLLYQAYGVDNEQYSAIFGDIDDYRITVIDMIKFIHEKMDYGVIDLDDDDEQELNDSYDDLIDGQEQLEGKNYSRIVFTYDTEVESEQSYELLDNVHQITNGYYPDALISCYTQNAKDLKESFVLDSIKISIITALVVFLILMFTFRSVSLPFILVATIQSSIWINFSIPYITGTHLYFIGYLVVSSIQMGATIDYAIVLTNRYVTLREGKNAKETILQSLNEAFPTILTSGSILTVAGFLVGAIATDPVISGLGVSLGRGTAISILLVMFILPQLLVLFDKIIAMTYFNIKTPERFKMTAVNTKGLIYTNGHIRGYVNGYIDGNFSGLIRGTADIRSRAGTEISVEKDEQKDKEEKENEENEN